MKGKSRPADLYIRLPEDKKGIKEELVKIAAKNDIPLNRLMVAIVQWFLEERKEKEFTIKLK
jgi:hypothetical protein